jgi:hypothetical protein
MDVPSLGPPSSLALAVEGLVCIGIYEFFRRRAERRRQRLEAEAEDEEPVLLPFSGDLANPYLSPAAAPAKRRAA